LIISFSHAIREVSPLRAQEEAIVLAGAAVKKALEGAERAMLAAARRGMV